MPCGNPYALGRTQSVFVALESTCGTQIKPVTGDAVKVLNASLAVEQERKSRDDKRNTRSLLERITGKASAPFSLETYLVPSGTAGTPPDAHLLLYGAFGAYANVPATSDTYSPGLFTSLRSHSLYAATGAGATVTSTAIDPEVMEMILGAIIESVTIAVSGGDEPKLSIEGWGLGHVHTGYSTQSGAPSGSDITVQTGDGANFEVGSLIQAGTDDNGGAGFLVTAVSGDTLSLDATPTSSDTDPVRPFVPAETTAGNPVNGVTGSITIGGTSFDVTSFDVTLANQFKPTDDYAFEQYPTDAIVQRRAVTGNVSMRASRDAVLLLGQRKLFGTHAINVVMGSGAGTTVTVNLPTVEYDFAALDIPEADEGIVNLPFTALGSSGEDEITLAFT